jgi:hypothetical protein
MSKYKLAKVDLPYQQVKRIVDEIEDVIYYCIRKSKTEKDPEKLQYLRGLADGCIRGSLRLIRTSRTLEAHQFSSLTGNPNRTLKYVIALLIAVIISISLGGNGA